MIQCNACGNGKISDYETICPICGTELVSPAVPNVTAATGNSTAPLASDKPSASPSTPPQSGVCAPVSSAASLAGGSQASLTVVRGGGLTNEKLTWPGNLVVVGKFDIDEGPVDVDLSPIPEAGYVSRRHCQIWPDPSGQWFVKDLGSSNGTFVRPQGEQRFLKTVGDQALKDGDELALGNARFVFHIESSHA